MTSEDNSPSPTMTNTTFTIDICKPLKKAKGIPKEEDCPNGSRDLYAESMCIVCGIERVVNTFENRTSFRAAIPIAGQYTLHGGTELDPSITRLKTSSSASDREKEGFRLELHGQKYPAKNGRRQKAVIEFLCLDKAEERDLTAMREEGEEDEVIGALKEEAEDDDGEEDHSATGETADDGHGGTLKYLDYAVVGDDKVLSLEWRTNIFLATAAYLIFGSWLNYNRYSARGWDLIPHSETIRDIPYIFKDWMRRVVNTLQGGGSRGGYSAV
ncbi:MAG: hypothetical protein Q9201_000330 [Fulgogasparrea decipioides]